MPMLMFVAGCLTGDPTPDTSRLPDPPPPLAQISQNATICDVRRYICDPDNPASRWVCSTACGNPAHCRDYNVIETAFCALHPDYFFRLNMYCDPWGNPTWTTNCVEGDPP
jgi:hypothetical protein